MNDSGAAALPPAGEDYNYEDGEGGLGGPGAFEGFIASAIAAILTIIFSWRYLINTEERHASALEWKDREPASPSSESESLISEPSSPLASEMGTTASYNSNASNNNQSEVEEPIVPRRTHSLLGRNINLESDDNVSVGDNNNDRMDGNWVLLDNADPNKNEEVWTNGHCTYTGELLHKKQIYPTGLGADNNNGEWVDLVREEHTSTRYPAGAVSSSERDGLLNQEKSSSSNKDNKNDVSGAALGTSDMSRGDKSQLNAQFESTGQSFRQEQYGQSQMSSSGISGSQPLHSMSRHSDTTEGQQGGRAVKTQEKEQNLDESVDAIRQRCQEIIDKHSKIRDNLYREQYHQITTTDAATFSDGDDVTDGGGKNLTRHQNSDSSESSAAEIKTGLMAMSGMEPDYVLGELMGEDSSDSEYCLVFKRVLDSITEENTEDIETSGDTDADVHDIPADDESGTLSDNTGRETAASDQQNRSPQPPDLPGGGIIQPNTSTQPINPISATTMQQEMKSGRNPSAQTPSVSTDVKDNVSKMKQDIPSIYVQTPDNNESDHSQKTYTIDSSDEQSLASNTATSRSSSSGELIGKTCSQIPFDLSEHPHSENETLNKSGSVGDVASSDTSSIDITYDMDKEKAKEAEMERVYGGPVMTQRPVTIGPYHDRHSDFTRGRYINVNRGNDEADNQKKEKSDTYYVIPGDKTWGASSPSSDIARDKGPIRTPLYLPADNNATSAPGGQERKTSTDYKQANRADKPDGLINQYNQPPGALYQNNRQGRLKTLREAALDAVNAPPDNLYLHSQYYENTGETGGEATIQNSFRANTASFGQQPQLPVPSQASCPSSRTGSTHSINDAGSLLSENEGESGEECSPESLREKYRSPRAWSKGDNTSKVAWRRAGYSMTLPGDEEGQLDGDYVLEHWEDTGSYVVDLHLEVENLSSEYETDSESRDRRRRGNNNGRGPNGNDPRPPTGPGRGGGVYRTSVTQRPLSVGTPGPVQSKNNNTTYAQRGNYHPAFSMQNDAQSLKKNFKNKTSVEPGKMESDLRLKAYQELEHLQDFSEEALQNTKQSFNARHHHTADDQPIGSGATFYQTPQPKSGINLNNQFNRDIVNNTPGQVINQTSLISGSVGPGIGALSGSGDKKAFSESHKSVSGATSAPSGGTVTTSAGTRESLTDQNKTLASPSLPPPPLSPASLYSDNKERGEKREERELDSSTRFFYGVKSGENQNIDAEGNYPSQSRGYVGEKALTNGRNLYGISDSKSETLTGEIKEDLYTGGRDLVDNKVCASNITTGSQGNVHYLASLRGDTGLKEGEGYDDRNITEPRTPPTTPTSIVERERGEWKQGGINVPSNLNQNTSEKWRSLELQITPRGKDDKDYSPTRLDTPNVTNDPQSLRDKGGLLHGRDKINHGARDPSQVGLREGAAGPMCKDRLPQYVYIGEDDPNYSQSLKNQTANLKNNQVGLKQQCHENRQAGDVKISPQGTKSGLKDGDKQQENKDTFNNQKSNQNSIKIQSKLPSDTQNTGNKSNEGSEHRFPSMHQYHDKKQIGDEKTQVQHRGINNEQVRGLGLGSAPGNKMGNQQGEGFADNAHDIDEGGEDGSDFGFRTSQGVPGHINGDPGSERMIPPHRGVSGSGIGGGGGGGKGDGLYRDNLMDLHSRPYHTGRDYQENNEKTGKQPSNHQDSFKDIGPMNNYVNISQNNQIKYAHIRPTSSTYMPRYHERDNQSNEAGKRPHSSSLNDPNLAPNLTQADDNVPHIHPHYTNNFETNDRHPNYTNIASHPHRRPISQNEAEAIINKDDGSLGFDPQLVTDQFSKHPWRSDALPSKQERYPYSPPSHPPLQTSDSEHYRGWVGGAQPVGRGGEGADAAAAAAAGGVDRLTGGTGPGYRDTAFDPNTNQGYNDVTGVPLRRSPSPRTCTAHATSTALARREEPSQSPSPDYSLSPRDALGSIVSATGNGQATGENPYIAVARATARAATIASASAAAGVTQLTPQANLDLNQDGGISPSSSEINVVISTSCTIKNDDHSPRLAGESRDVLTALNASGQHSPGKTGTAISDRQGYSPLLREESLEGPKKMMITIEQEGAQEKRSRTVECELPTNTQNEEDLSNVITAAVKRILKSSGRSKSPGPGGDKNLDDIIERVTQQVIQAYSLNNVDPVQFQQGQRGSSYRPVNSYGHNGIDVTSIRKTHKPIKSESVPQFRVPRVDRDTYREMHKVGLCEGENDLEKYAVPVNIYGHRMQYVSDYSRSRSRSSSPEKRDRSLSSENTVFYVTGTGPNGHSISNFDQDEVVLKISKDRRRQLRIENISASETESGSEAELPPGRGRRGRPQSGKMASKHQDGPVSQRREVLSSDSEGPKKIKGILRNTSREDPSRITSPENQEATGQRQKSPKKQTPSIDAITPSSSKKPVHQKPEKKPYESVLLTPVKNAPTPINLAKKYDIGEKQISDQRAKLEDARKGYLDLVPKNPPWPSGTILDAAFEEKKRRWMERAGEERGRGERGSKGQKGRGSFQLVDIYIDQDPFLSRRAKSQSSEDLKKKLSNTRLRAPNSSNIDQRWQAIPKLKPYKSHSNLLDEKAFERVNKGQSRDAYQTTSDDLRRAKSLGTLPGQFFANKRSYTSLIETDLDTGLSTETPLIYETDLDSIIQQKTRSLTNLSMKTSLVDIDIEEDRRKSLEHLPNNGSSLHYSLPSNHNGGLEGAKERCLSAGELRIAQSLTKLSIPEWYRQSFGKGKKAIELPYTRQLREGSGSDSLDSSFESGLRRDPFNTSFGSFRDGSHSPRPVVIQHRVSNPMRGRSISPGTSHQTQGRQQENMHFELPSSKLKTQHVDLKPVEMKPFQIPPVKIPQKNSAKEAYLRLKAQNEAQKGQPVTTKRGQRGNETVQVQKGAQNQTLNPNNLPSGKPKMYSSSQGAGLGQPLKQDAAKSSYIPGKTCTELVKDMNDLKDGDEEGEEMRSIMVPDAVYTKMMVSIETQRREIKERAEDIKNNPSVPPGLLDRDESSIPSRDAFPVLSYKESPAFQKRQGSDKERKENNRAAKPVAKTAPKKPPRPGLPKNAQKTNPSLNQVIDSLIPLSPTGDSPDASDDDDNPDASPRRRVFRLLKNAATPRSSMASINTSKSHENLSDEENKPEIGQSNTDPRIPSAKITEEDAIVKCRNPKCKKATKLSQARMSYKTCHNCYTYYCGRECRKAHWERHKRKCVFSRINSVCKHIVKKVHDSSKLLEEMSKVARTGYMSKGRGCVLVAFSSPEKADEFLQEGNTNLESPPGYANLEDLNGASDIFGEHFTEMFEMCKSYNPEIKFVIEVAVVSGQEIQTWPVPRREGPAIKKCAKLRLSSAQPNPGMARGGQETLILTAVPGAEFTENMEERKAREICFVNIQRKLRQRGVSLRHHFPEVYAKLCSYVADNANFTPMTIYPMDANTGKRFMCLIMPNSEPEVEWMHNPDLLDELGLATQV